MSGKSSAKKQKTAKQNTLVPGKSLQKAGSRALSGAEIARRTRQSERDKQNAGAGGYTTIGIHKPFAFDEETKEFVLMTQDDAASVPDTFADKQNIKPWMAVYLEFKMIQIRIVNKDLFGFLEVEFRESLQGEDHVVTKNELASVGPDSTIILSVVPDVVGGDTPWSLVLKYDGPDPGRCLVEVKAVCRPIVR
jgi:hypothetical protein